MTLLGIYYSDPATTWDMPTTDQPYLLLQLGTKGTQWNIPVLAFGLYSFNMYRCLRKSTNGTDYENTQWAQVQ